MKWTGLVVILIVPAAFVMICVAVFLESSGILGRIRHRFRKFSMTVKAFRRLMHDR
jgi:hypothetical protein